MHLESMNSVAAPGVGTLITQPLRNTVPYHMAKDLQRETWRKDLEEIVEIFVQNPEKLSPLRPSQACEALNNTIGTKSPKICYYGSSESNDYRVATALSQKNLGHDYVSTVSVYFLFLFYFFYLFITGHTAH